MNEEKLNFYLNLVPPEIRDAASGLHNAKHWAVYIMLLENGDTNFSAIGKELDLNATDTINILRDLIRAGLVVRYTDSLTINERRARSFYKVTPIGQGFINSLMDHFLPQPSQKKGQAVGTKRGQTEYREEDLYRSQDMRGYSSTPGEPETEAGKSVNAVFESDDDFRE